MVLPEDTETRPTRNSTSRGTWFAVAAGVLIVGALVVVFLTSPETDTTAEGASTTTSTISDLVAPVDAENFAVDQIATGPPLNWSEVYSIPDSDVMPPVTHEGAVYLFMPETIEDRWSGHVTVLRTDDGSSWKPAGDGIDVEGLVVSATSTPRGLLLVEQSPESGFVLWQSSDGDVWDATEVEVPGEPGATFNVHSVGGNDRLIVVSGEHTSDWQLNLENALTAAGYSPDLATNGWNLEMINGENRVVFYGPFGIRVLELTPAELGLTDQEVNAAFNGGGPSRYQLWVSADGGDFRPVDSEEMPWVESFSSAPDGSLIVFGWSNSGNGVWKTWDGVIWERVAIGTNVWTALQWEGRLLGAPYDGIDLLDSFDGSRWEQLEGLHDRFPPTLQWHTSNFGVGEAGLVMTAESYEETTGPMNSYEPVVLEKDGFTLTIDLNSGVIEVVTPSGASQTWFPYGPEQDGLEPDPAASVLMLSVGEESVGFTFEELADAESEYWTSFSWAPTLSHSALVFTPDGDDWSITDLGPLKVDGMALSGLTTTAESVVALMVDNDGGREQFEIWTAPLP